MKKISVLFFFMLLSCTIWASWQPPVSNFFQSTYVAGTQNWQIRQQHNGWIYFANNYGLLEFDGNSWSTYGIWNSTVIRSLSIADDGAIYVGGSDEFGVFKANRHGELDYTRLSHQLPEKYKSFGEVWGIHLLKGELLVQTKNYIFIQETTGKFRVVDPQTKILNSIIVGGTLYVATSDGLSILSGDQLIALRGTELLKGNDVCSIQPYQSDKVLIGTNFGGLFVFDGRQIVPFKTEADGFIKRNQLYSLAVSDKYIAYGTVLDGLVLTDLNGQNCRYFNHENGLQNNTILSLFFDVDHNLWLGLDNGIDRIALESPIANLYGPINFFGSGYTSFINNNLIYLGTNQGLYSSQYPLNPSARLTQLDMVQNSHGQVWHLSKIGSTLFCSHNRGLFVVEGNKLNPLFTADGVWKIAQFVSNPNIALMGTYNGFHLLKNENGRWVYWRKISGFNATARVFEIDSNNNIWVVTNKGIMRLKLQQQWNSCSAEIVIPIHGEHEYFGMSKIENQIVVSSIYDIYATNGSGEMVSSEKFRKLLDGVHLYPSIQLDENKNLWFIVGNSLKVRLYDSKNHKYSSALTELWDVPFFYIGGFESFNLIGRGDAIVGNVHGFALCNLSKNLSNRTKLVPQVFVRKISVTTPKDSVVYGESYPLVAGDLRIKHANNSIRIDFGSTLSLDNSNQYSFCLEPKDSEWSQWSTSISKEYTNLREGRYTFHLRMRNVANGDVREKSFEFTVLPPWYRSNWMLIFYLLLFSALSYSAYKYILYRVEMSKMKLEQRKDDEMREKEKEFIKEVFKKENEIIRLNNDRLEFELKSKSQELANMLLGQLNKNEILSEIKSDVKRISVDLQGSDIDGAKRRLINLQGKISQNIEQNVDWKKFEENFDIVNDKFIKKLSEKYPWLNKSERKLCVYIKMGLLTKEIAPLMNLSTRGVEMLRYRMRKKMDLDRNDDLQGYFQQLSHEANAE